MNELDIFSAALENSDPIARNHYLDQACQGHPDLRKRIDALLLMPPKQAAFWKHHPRI